MDLLESTDRLEMLKRVELVKVTPEQWNGMLALSEDTESSQSLWRKLKEWEEKGLIRINEGETCKSFPL